ncbi:MAG: glutathione S-transferase family protein [Myxococcales bacterium]|nr:glutathione S-transferase family protein [Myxococcales bacterium]
MPKIVLYQYAADVGVESGSPFCVKVHRLLGYKGLEYATHDVAGPGVMKRISPRTRKVPVLGYDDELVTDSSRIFAFVDARHPSPPLWPDDAVARARARLLEDWADESLYWFAVQQRWAVDTNFEPFRARAFGRMPAPLRWFVPGVIRRSVLGQLHGQGIGRLSAEQVLEGLDEHARMLDTLLEEGPFLAGRALTGADLAVFAPLRAVAVTEATPEAAAIVRKHPRLTAWLLRVDEATTSPHTQAFRS